MLRVFLALVSTAGCGLLSQVESASFVLATVCDGAITLENKLITVVRLGSMLFGIAFSGIADCRLKPYADDM